jgi:hypothetical protein
MLVSIDQRALMATAWKRVFAANGQLLVEKGFIALTQRLVRLRMDRGV